VNLGRRASSGWLSLFVTRREVLQTTWTFRIVLAAFLAVLVLGTADWWTPALGTSLTCREDVTPSDALLLENFDPDYLVFERATTLYHANVAQRVFVPMPAQTPSDPRTPNSIAAGVAEVMARVAHLPAFEVIPVVESEPITLTVGRQIRQRLSREGIKSVTLVSPDFRSRRSEMIYSSVFGPGITVRCVPVFGRVRVDNWTETWHGIQEVGLQFLKLQYYRFWVFA
jgi:hypothetical protein